MTSFSKLITSICVCGLLTTTTARFAYAAEPCSTQAKALSDAQKKESKMERKRDSAQNKMANDDEKYQDKIDSLTLRRNEANTRKQQCHSLWSILTSLNKLLKCEQKYDNQKATLNSRIGSTQNAKVARHATNNDKLTTAQQRLDDAHADTQAKQTAYNTCMGVP